MKRNTPRHPKTAHLAALLQLERWGAVGILESIWHFGAQFAPRGDIGRYAEEEIARGIDWKGPSAPLIQALRTARWLDPCACHRLRVHDWPDHADQTVQRSKEVQRYGFLECYGQGGRMGGTSSASVELAGNPSFALAEKTSQPLPLPLPEPLPTTPPNPPASAGGLHDGPLGEGSVRSACRRLVAYGSGELAMRFTRRDRRTLLERLRGGQPEAEIRAALAAQAQEATARRAHHDRTRWLIDRARPSGGLLDQLLAAVGTRVPSHSFAIWFRPLQDLGVIEDDDGARLLVGMPNDQYAEWIARNYRSVIDEACGAIGRSDLGFTPLVVPPGVERPP